MRVIGFRINKNTDQDIKHRIDFYAIKKIELIFLFAKIRRHFKILKPFSVKSIRKLLNIYLFSI